MSASSAGFGDAVNPARDPFPSGVRLVRTKLGGVAVVWDGKPIGWMHATIGDRWNAYAPGPNTGDPGELLGRFTEEEAVWRIALQAGWHAAG